MSATDEWVKASRELREKFSDRILSEDYLNERVKLATYFIEKYPDFFGDPKMIGRGTPNHSLKRAKKALADINR